MASRHEVLVKLRDHAARVCVELAVNMHAELVEATPVDTGFARAMWVPSLSAPAFVTATDAAGGRALTEAGLGAVLAFKLEDGAIFVSNRTRYIRRLDGGSSTQAPAGFVRTAIAKAIIAGGNGQLVPA